jgi:hypothetical protein
MRKIAPILGAVLFPLLAALSLPSISALAAHHMRMSGMITGAKTSADHGKLAAQYEQEAKASRAKAEEHKIMADAYRKAGGPLIAPG